MSALALSGPATFIRRHPLLAFFGIAYVGAWLVWAPWVLSQYGVGLFNVGSTAIQALSYVGAFAGPTLAAFLMTWRLAGKEGVGVLCRRYILWRIKPRWYLVALVIIPAFVALSIIILPGATTSYTGKSPIQITAAFLTRLVLFGIIGGPLAEEPGWRGFALPLLQNRYGPLKASVLLGVAWSLWHLPLFLTASEGGGPGVALSHVILLFAQFVPATVAFALVLTWLFNHTHGSLLVAILAHAALNASAVLLKAFPSDLVAHSNLPILIGMGVFSLILLAATKGHLRNHVTKDTDADCHAHQLKKTCRGGVDEQLVAGGSESVDESIDKRVHRGGRGSKKRSSLPGSRMEGPPHGQGDNPDHVEGPTRHHRHMEGR